MEDGGRRSGQSRNHRDRGGTIGKKNTGGGAKDIKADFIKVPVETRERNKAGQARSVKRKKENAANQRDEREVVKRKMASVYLVKCRV